MDQGFKVEDIETAYRQHWRSIHRVAAQLVGKTDADTVVQEVFVELLRNSELRGRFTEGSLDAWLAAIGRRKAFELLRRVGREIPSDEIAESGVSTEPAMNARILVERFLREHVPAEQKQFFVSRFLEERTQAEVAQMLGIARTTLEGWEHRLAVKLRRFLVARKT